MVTIGYDTVGNLVVLSLYDSPAQDYTSYTNRNTSITGNYNRLTLLQQR